MGEYNGRAQTTDRYSYIQLQSYPFHAMRYFFKLWMILTIVSSGSTFVKWCDPGTGADVTQRSEQSISQMSEPKKESGETL